MTTADVLIGIDDTDNISSRGTGWLAQQMIAALRERGLGRCSGATRHQLLKDPRIPFTSHNSDACMAWHLADGVSAAEVTDAAGAYLSSHSAPGSDPGLAVAEPARLGDDARARLHAFGRAAQTEVLAVADAWALAAATGVHLSGHGGTQEGVVGALAGVGLHLAGDDGFFLWMPGTRELPDRMTYAALLATVPIDTAEAPDGSVPAADDEIDLGDWVRPVLRGGRAVLLLDRPRDDGAQPRWRTASRAVVRAYAEAPRAPR